MEEICETLVQKIGEGGNCGYCVFYEGELFDVLPEDKRDRATLTKALKYLSDGGYIDMRYARGNAFCIAFLKNFEIKKENAPVPADTPEKYQYKLSAKALILLCFAAFSGGLLGGVICFVAGVVF